MIRSHVLICGGTGCTSSGSPAIREHLEKELTAHGLADEIKVVQTGCFGLCALGPIMIVYPEGTFYSRVTEEDVTEIVEEHLLKGRVVDHLVYNEPAPGNAKHEVASLSDTGFYKTQMRVALRNCGVINPEDIEEYIGMDGYQALGKVLTSMTPQEVIDLMKASGLRGRGGAGFPTGMKWQFAANNACDTKYVICNADEGDPGAFMDRSVLEGDPHAVLEAMAIAGYAIGAHHGYIYVRAEYPIAVKRLEIAIRQAREYGMLGKDIFGSGFDFDIDIRLGAGAFVCGEETALIRSIEGKRGMPGPRPPFPTEKGLFGKPTVINNVETIANVPGLILNGRDWFVSVGTKRSRGTKVFALSGKVVRTGIVEVAMGVSLRSVIEEIGGGMQNRKRFKAVQIGGPSGGCIPASHADLPIDYETLREFGAMMGSGGLVAMDEDTCMVDVAKYFMEFIQNESCGKCVPCREGTRQLREILEQITRPRSAEHGDDALLRFKAILKLRNLADVIRSTSLCGLGRTAPNPVLSTLRWFRDEYEAHIYDRRCPAGVCKGLIRCEIDPALCRGCTVCARACAHGAIVGSAKSIHRIDQIRCTGCGACLKVCKFHAIRRLEE